MNDSSDVRCLILSGLLFHSFRATAEKERLPWVLSLVFVWDLRHAAPLTVIYVMMFCVPQTRTCNNIVWLPTQSTIRLQILTQKERGKDIERDRQTERENQRI